MTTSSETESLNAARCTECGEPATGVIRSRGDNFIYTAKCDRHGEEEAAVGRCWFDRWGVVGPISGPISDGGVRYTRVGGTG